MLTRSRGPVAVILQSIHAPTPPPPLHRSLQAANTIRSQPTGRFYLGLLPAPPACTSMSLRTYSHQLAALDAKAVKAWLQGASWLRRASKGLKHTAAHNAKISAALKGKTLTAATKAKLSAALKGKPNAKLAAALKGKTLTAAHKAKISAAMKKKKGKTAA